MKKRVCDSASDLRTDLTNLTRWPIRFIRPNDILDLLDLLDILDEEADGEFV